MGFTQEKIEEYKAKYGEIFKIEVGGKSALLRKPTRKQLAYISESKATNNIKASEFLLKECWIEGDQEIIDDDELFLGVIPILGKIIEVKQAQLEKL